MNDKLIKALHEYKPTQQDVREFAKSVQEQEEQYRETTRKLTPTQADRNRYYNM